MFELAAGCEWKAGRNGRFAGKFLVAIQLVGDVTERFAFATSAGRRCQIVRVDLLVCSENLKEQAEGWKRSSFQNRSEDVTYMYNVVI